MNIFRLLLHLLLLAAPACAWAQEGFDETLTFPQIDSMLKDANDRRDVRRQGVLWYKWAYYELNTYGNRSLMFEYLTNSVTRFSRIGDSLAYFRVRAELADLLPEESSDDEAMLIQQGALDYFRRHQHTQLEARLLVSLTRIYNLKGDTTTASVFKKAFRERNDVLRDTLLEIRFQMDEVMRYQREKKYKNALYMAFRVRDNSNSAGYPYLATWAEYQIGHLNFLNGESALAIQLLTRAEKNDIPLYDTLRRNIYRDLAAIYGKKDSLAKAYDYAMKYSRLSDELLERERQATYQRLTHQFRVDAKSRRLDDLEEQKATIENAAQQQRLVSWALAVALGATFLLMFFMVRFYRHRLHTNRVIAEIKEQINQQTIRQLEDALRIESMQSMIEGQETERRRVAHDLHDSVGGLLAATKIRLENLSAKLPLLSENEEFGKIKHLLDDTIAETRQISRNLQPGSLHQFGLMKAVSDLISRVQGAGVPAIDFQHFGDFSQLDHTLALNCYRIVQELLQNSQKHAKATEILVQLSRTDSELTLLVEDNGKGYDPDRVNKGMGTDNVAQRVQFLKGEISIQSAEGQGTSTMITVPLV
ncbi:MAG: sensor histidine kinase [Saprospiraceae bacterium]|nr:sensor histidine kinase [Saprospiraceae bacterium]